MGTKSHQAEEPKNNFYLNKQIDWQEINEFLNEGLYEKAAQQISNISIPKSDNNPYLDHILAAARQICLICRQVHAETELHQEAYHEALRRERELQQQLTLILDLLVQYFESDDLAEKEDSSPMKAGLEPAEDAGNGRTWWQQLRSRFSRPKPQKAIESPVEDNVKVLGETAVVPEAPRTAPPKKNPSLTIYCLGTFRTYVNDHFIDNWNGNKSKSIFKYMAVHREQPISVDILMDLFWSGDDPEAARRNLYQAIYLLRQALQTGQPDYPYILSSNGFYELNPKLNVWLDSEKFLQHIQNGQLLNQDNRRNEAVSEFEAAENLYENDFLQEDIYEDWPATQRAMLKNKHIELLSRLAKHYYKEQNWPLSITYNQKLVREDNCHENAHRRLMQTYLNQGQRHLALRQYYRCVEALQNELNVTPMPETTQLYQFIESG